jgi:hypothetical protein
MITQLILFRRLEFGEVLEIKIDFLHNRQVYGVELLSADHMMCGLRQHNGIPVVADHIRFLDRWLFNLFVGQPTDKKYDSDFEVICINERERLMGIRVPMLGSQLAATLIDQVSVGSASGISPLPRVTRFRLLARFSLRGFPYGLCRLKCFFWQRVRNLLLPQGIFLSVSGPDD